MSLQSAFDHCEWVLAPAELFCDKPSHLQHPSMTKPASSMHTILWFTSDFWTCSLQNSQFVSVSKKPSHLQHPSTVCECIQYPTVPKKPSHLQHPSAVCECIHYPRGHHICTTRLQFVSVSKKPSHLQHPSAVCECIHYPRSHHICSTRLTVCECIQEAITSAAPVCSLWVYPVSKKPSHLHHPSTVC